MFWLSKAFITMWTLVSIFSMIHQQMATERGRVIYIFVTNRTFATFVLFMSQKYMIPTIERNHYQNVNRLDIVDWFNVQISRNLYITLTNMRSVILELVHKICTATILHCQSGRVTYLSRDQALILHSLYDVSSCVHTQGSLVPNFYRIRYIFEHFPGC